MSAERYRLDRWLGNLNGDQDIGRSVGFWLAFLAIVAAGVLAPEYLSRYQLLNLSNFLGSGFLALSLCLIWGYCGILSLGQAAFMGIGGYAYGIVGINLIEESGNTNLALLAGLFAPVLVAALLGYVMFYGRLRGVYVAILMFVTTQLIQAFLNQTAGPNWFIGKAHLGGNNGLGRFSGDIREPPNLTLGFGDNLIEFEGKRASFYYLSFGLLVATYLALRWLVNSGWGRVMVALREDPDRTESFGYNVRLIQLLVFCLSAFLAAISGVLYVTWGNFITPDVFSVYNNILPVIWVAVSGRKSLTATVVGALLLVWLSQWLALQGDLAFIVLGTILIVAMMLAPDGVVTGLLALRQRWSRRRAAGRRGAEAVP